MRLRAQTIERSLLLPETGWMGPRNRGIRSGNRASCLMRLGTIRLWDQKDAHPAGVIRSNQAVCPLDHVHVRRTRKGALPSNLREDT